MRARVLPLEEAGTPGGVQRLRSRVYAHYIEAHEAEWHASVYDWIYTHPLAEHIHRWVAVSEGEVVGHLAAIPQHYRVGGERVIAYTPADYMSLPGHGLAALSLLKKFYATVDNHVSCDMVPAVIALESKMGAQPAGQMDYAAKLLDVGRLPVPPLPASLERALGLQKSGGAARGYGEGQGEGHGEGESEEDAPPPARPRLPLPAPAVRGLNGLLRAADGGLARLSSGRVKVTEASGFDGDFDLFFEKVAAKVGCVPEKGAEFLSWRYGPGSPQHPVTLLTAREGGELIGYAVLRVTRESMQGFREAFILDLTVLPGRRDAARDLLAESVRRFREAGVPIVRYRFSTSSTSPSASDLSRLGFFKRTGRSNTLLVRFEDSRLHALASDIDNWSYSLGDGEATFWVL